LLAFILGIEAIVVSVYADGAALASKPGIVTRFVGEHGAWIVKGLIGFGALFAIFVLLAYRSGLALLAGEIAATSINARWFSLHFAAIALFGVLSRALYADSSGGFPPDVIAVAWIGAAFAVVSTVGLAVAPCNIWSRLIRGTRKLIVSAFAASALACFAGAMSWNLWGSTSRLTFTLVRFILGFFVTNIVVQPWAMRVGTHRFTVVISEQCSGLEGAALILIFGLFWLVLCRKDLRFPQAIALVPAGVAILFLLNAVRIAALILIGHAGAREIATRGFHSQAGWIAFNCVAFAFAIASRHLPWFTVAPRHHVAEFAAAPYLAPFLAILAAGMISRASSGIFEWPYGLRVLAALAALWFFRKRFTEVDWRTGWPGPLTGVVVFAFWIGFDRVSGAAMPSALAAATPTLRNAWIALRVIGAVLTVPIAEELAFRGFLLRRLVSADFENVAWRNFTMFALLASSVLFGLMHGDRWLAGTLAGLCYAGVSLRTGRLGEAIAAHATTNALIAIYVLCFGHWYFW